MDWAQAWEIPAAASKAVLGTTPRLMESMACRQAFCCAWVWLDAALAAADWLWARAV